MHLTCNQKKSLRYALIPFTIIGVIVLLCWGVVSLWPSSSQADTPPVPQVNASHFEQINTSNDQTTDHYCLGHEGLFFGPARGDFSVVKDDPLCP